ncbi:MAG: bifunctional (p)ppGpp synthetase/guanosine-3',5'-bis(diphosphate) 3'-pyrophosphohydrolase [Actinomycetota bacterium]|nr:bifunctional (p)ppGpp synthetase/guanosine-3',5'-bis(diphosphate) 3'-pyrophosphohydrolase [Actinomycetota bacterium]MEC9394759.1 bifunctional (p)ppGpp synthetase/guanosine-3',5'-bis(diphosphate) 3'-pyrophosphohydrolase [Actinomycetota bacterium]MED6327659.1 bifunctional (p)ppGpp synthetase/guanosine-3',5'-bis(diphosphate) 3'-pyrophosphohydrolase [Actinomycetota bacterium]MEE2957987.1 bifunctional (p)ppGpp synthetase/guanosine-3',5'-bis(diphosphate) 3'-pyrophosphohydrolase [Actinomycetota bact
MTRVLPWRRRPRQEVDETSSLLTTFRERHPGADTTLIERAYRVALDAHAGQTRKSGEPYIHHPMSVATIVARQGLDDVTVASALLHDAVEDTSVSLDDLERDFGVDVRMIVDGVTKLDRLHFDTKEDQQAASVRKMLVALAKDLRVLIIKLADRLHNMRTLAALPEHKQQRVAQETLDIFAPLANRLGMQEVKDQLEDLALATLHPKRYSQIDQMVQDRSPERDLYLAQVIGEVEARLAEVGITGTVDGRPKQLWSIYEKMIVKGRSFDDIHDLVGVRVVVDNVRDCYAALGTIHATWKPVQGRFKDYVAMPKFNLYQSLHTTVVGPQGKQVEFQVRTHEMHARAEHGVAAHWDYKAQSPSDEMAWLGRIVEWQAETEDPSIFMANLKTDLELDEVYVFTPRGKVVTLPVGATPVDFAYTIHTDVGHACVGAKVGGRLVPLDAQLTTGDTVEIVTSRQPDAGPSQDWLRFVATHRASSKIKHWYSQERRSDAIDAGYEELVSELRRAGLPVREVLDGLELAEAAAAMNYQESDALYAAIGEHHVSARSLVARVARTLRADEPVLEPSQTRRPRRNTGSVGVHVEGLDDLLVRLSRCCTPVPPDGIIGFVTRGRGVSVHRADCANAVSLTADQADRLIDVEWDEESDGHFVVSVVLKALDRPGLLRDVTGVLADHHVNVLATSTSTSGLDRVATMRFDFEMGDPGHLESLLRMLRRVDSVYDVHRVVPGGGD